MQGLLQYCGLVDYIMREVKRVEAHGEADEPVNVTVQHSHHRVCQL